MTSKAHCILSTCIKTLNTSMRRMVSASSPSVLLPGARLFSSEAARSRDMSFVHERPSLVYPKEDVLLASLPYINEYGWTHHTLGHGAASLGLSRASHGIFDRGASELLEYFLQDCNKRLALTLTEQGLRDSSMPVPQKVRIGVETRLRMLAPYIHVWPQAVAIAADPRNAPYILKLGAEALDEIWYQAGDNSIDFNWYTKRATLGAVYTSTELFMLQDKSEDFKDTWDFLDRRLQDVGQFGKFKGDVTSGLELLISTADTMLKTYRPR